MAREAIGMFVVVGEALVDVGADGTARPGGSPYNVALGLARLDRHAVLAARLSGDAYGRTLREHAVASGVDVSWCPHAAEPTTTARVQLRDGVAEYEFTVDGTADFGWTGEELAALPDSAAVHFGSLASWLPRSDALIAERVRAYRNAGALVSYDPNVRPGLQPDATRARHQVEEAIGLAHLVKASSDDLTYLYPDQSLDEVARRWLDLGPALVVVTAGPDGAVAHTRTCRVHLPVYRVAMVDTVGAGDAFTSGLLDALAGLESPTPALVADLADTDLAAVLDHAAVVAGLTCARVGADPPRRAELPCPG
jgi:fructokinase